MDHSQFFPTSIRFPKEIREAIEKAAADERRSFSAMVVYILWDWLKAKGRLRG